MSASDMFYVFGPFLGLVLGMVVTFGVVHYNDVKGN